MGEWCKNARCGIWVSVDMNSFRSAALIFLISLVNNKENTIVNQTLFIHRIALRSDITLGKEGWVATRRTFCTFSRNIGPR